MQVAIRCIQPPWVSATAMGEWVVGVVVPAAQTLVAGRENPVTLNVLLSYEYRLSHNYITIVQLSIGSRN